jgi:hypothetical protein
MKIQPVILSLLLNFLPLNIALTTVTTSQVALGQTQETKSSYTNDPNLISPDTKVDYNSLAQLLAQGEWRKANDETGQLLLQSSQRQKVGWIRVDDIKKLSCWDIKTIDSLWKQYSQGRFGFSVQLPIFIETGNKPGRLISDDAYLKFADRIGWRVNGDWVIFIENLDYSLNAPVGHLPNPRPEYEITGGRLQYTAFAQRMVECKIDTN